MKKMRDNLLIRLAPVGFFFQKNSKETWSLLNGRDSRNRHHPAHRLDCLQNVNTLTEN